VFAVRALQHQAVPSPTDFNSKQEIYEDTDMTKATSFAAAAAAVAIVAGASVAQANTQPAPQAQPAATVNFFDPASWFNFGQAQSTPAVNTAMALNPAHPAGWAVAIDPRTHNNWHMAMMNPATYAQFASPQFYMQFANPQNLMAWVNPASYAVLMDPNTYAYWMNPNSYTHATNMAMYMQPMNMANYGAFMNPNTYMAWMNPAAYTVASAQPAGTLATTSGVNYFDAWFKMFQPQQQAAPAAPATK